MPEVSCNEVSNINQDQRQRNSRNIANVLIVDSDPELVRFMLEILAGKGILGHLAGDKKEASDFLEKNSCDLVFTSNRIGGCSTRRSQAQSGRTPKEDGFELLQKIRENSPELPVFMIAEIQKQKNRKRRTR